MTKDIEWGDGPEPDQFTPCPRTVRMCIEALPKGLPFDTDEMDFGWDEHLRSSMDALEALLPKPDRAEELANEWMNRAYWPDMGVDMAVVEYTRDLIERGEIKG